MIISERHEVDSKSRWICVGELGGHFDALQRLLIKVDFQPSTDLLVLPGNFLGVTPTSRMAPAWLAKPWVKAILGEHEIALIAQLRGERTPTLVGQWLRKMSQEQQALLKTQLGVLPMTLELRKADSVSLVSHRHIPLGASWSGTKAQMEASTSYSEALGKMGSRLDGLKAGGFIGKPEHKAIDDICLNISSLVVEKPTRIYSRNANRCILLSSAPINQGRRFDCPALLPFVELSSLIEQNLEKSKCQGLLDTLSNS
ncbi:hypothetical protein [Pseudomonas serbica]|uniref:hypothetical protein n=1 Tax=Pseudomonas serbica TaxID=2965074 RepID=UPI00237B8E09|nr:hypothetical protein [Pseudomonas serbica]